MQQQGSEAIEMVEQGQGQEDGGKSAGGPPASTTEVPDNEGGGPVVTHYKTGKGKARGPGQPFIVQR